MEERDIILLTDENGEQLEAEVLDYFFAEGQEYALLAEIDEEEEACEDPDCEDCEIEREIFIMKVITHEDDTEEFISVEDADAERLYELYQQNVFEEEGDDESGEYGDDKE